MGDVRVLIVDDQAPFRDAARAVIELTDGFVVAGEARSGEESIEEAARVAPDLVIMDVNLPGIDGIEATRRLSLTGAPAVLLVSTYDEEDYARRAEECGALAYLPKSDFGPAALVDAWVAADA